MKKLLAVLFFGILACAFFALSASCAELTAEITVSEGKNEKLTDNNFKTKIKFDDCGSVKIHSSEGEISYVYVIWDNPPGKWYLSEEDIAFTHGQNDFIHEFIKLNSPCDSITVNVPSGKTLCDVRIFSEGDIPKDVQIWDPPYERADLLMLPTHSDDDHLYFGGTMPYYGGELGMRVQVAYITNHWKEPVRTHELLNGLWTVGITAYPVISDIPDLPTFSLESAKEVFDTDEMRGYIVELIRRFKPYVLLGHDLLGEYGHGAHMLSAHLITEAVEISMDPESYPESYKKYGAWDVPKTYLHNYEENQIRMDWDTPLTRFDGKTGFEMAKEGFKCHVSQHKYELAVIRNGRCSCRFFGLYRTTVGNDVTGKDFFENVVFEDETPPETQEITESQTEVSTEETLAETDVLTDGISEQMTESETEYFTESDEERKQRIRSEVICFSLFGVLAALTVLAVILKIKKR